MGFEEIDLDLESGSTRFAATAPRVATHGEGGGRGSRGVGRQKGGVFARRGEGFCAASSRLYHLYPIRSAMGPKSFVFFDTKFDHSSYSKIVQNITSFVVASYMHKVLQY